ncbi:MAG: acyl carrier protein phosphodiesterase, partial [Bacteroidota bacterium]
FIGDFVKGHQYKNYAENIKNGVLLHRAIDEYTDAHPIVLQSKDKLRSGYRHYSGVIVDMVYDHLLAANWVQYHAQDLLSFTIECYTVLDSYRNILPDRFNLMFQYMKHDNWLFNYTKLEGIHKALSGMAKRTKFDSKMEMAIDDIKEYYPSFKKEFQQFMPEVVQFSQKWLKDYAQAI